MIASILDEHEYFIGDSFALKISEESTKKTKGNQFRHESIRKIKHLSADGSQNPIKGVNHERKKLPNIWTASSSSFHYLDYPIIRYSLFNDD